ncbi:MAG TPA: hypothetical protein VKE40_11115 [Gemmataceae bacterium]|nr:hypothetical protein [Gemmataceae bacterium]
MKLRTEKYAFLALAVAALVLPLTPAVANPPSAPRWHVVVSSSPHIPQDVWFAGMGNNTDRWTSGGSICLNQLAQGFPNGEQVTMLLDIVEGGIIGQDGSPVQPGAYTFPGITEPTFDYTVTSGTSFYVMLDAYVVQSSLSTFPQGATFTFMFMWDFDAGRSDRHVVLWLFDGDEFQPFLNEGIMMANVRLLP